MARAHGLRGHLVIDIDPTLVDLVVPGLAVRLEKTQRTPLDSEIAAVRVSGNRMVCGIAALDDRAAAEAWRGAAVLVDRATLPATGEDEYFDFELLGASVVERDGTPLGAVCEIVATGANDVWVVRGPRGEILIPATRVAIVEIDRAGRRIVVDANALVYEEDRKDS